MWRVSFRLLIDAFEADDDDVWPALADEDAYPEEQNGRAICAPIVGTTCVNLTLRSMVN